MRILRNTLGLILALGIVGGAIAQPTPASAPSSTQPASQPAASPPKSVLEILTAAREKHKLPAMGGAIVTSDGMVAKGAVGLRAVGSTEAVTDNDLWHLGSCTKAMTATLCAILVEDGKLRWDMTITEVFPELKDEIRPEYQNVTLELLLTNRGGVPANLIPSGVWAKLWKLQTPPREQRLLMLREALKLPPDTPGPNTPAGSRMIYSNQNFAVAGAMAEKVMNQSWEELIQNRLFRPLGIYSAGFGPPGSGKRIDQPRGHRGAPGAEAAVSPAELGADNPPAIGPAGVVHMTLDDWGKFIAAHLRQDGMWSVRTASQEPRRLLSPETLQKLHTPPQDEEYAFGWGVTRRQWGGTVLTHAGSNTLWFCVAWVAPEQNFAVFVTCNCGNKSAVSAADEVAYELIKLHTKKK